MHRVCRRSVLPPKATIGTRSSPRNARIEQSADQKRHVDEGIFDRASEMCMDATVASAPGSDAAAGRAQRVEWSDRGTSAAWIRTQRRLCTARSCARYFTLFPARRMPGCASEVDGHLHGRARRLDTDEGS